MAEIALIMNEPGPGLSASLLCQLNRLVQLMLLLDGSRFQSRDTGVCLSLVPEL